MPAAILGKHYITQGYGKTAYAQSPAGKIAYKSWGGQHYGIDLGTNGINLPALSTCSGTIVTASAQGAWGNLIELLGDDGWIRQYAHLSTIEVGVGMVIAVGHRLGNVGTTGASTGVHLHYGHRRKKIMGWDYRDPAFELKEPEATKMPRVGIIKLYGAMDMAFWTGSIRHKIPNPKTLARFISNQEPNNVSADIWSKMVEGEPIPDLGGNP